MSAVPTRPGLGADVPVSDDAEALPEGLASRVDLRRLGTGDLDRVAELEVELFGSAAWARATYEDELALPRRCYLAAVGPDGDLVGYAGIALAADSEVMTVGVVAAWRRLGIGTRLVEALVAAAREVPARRVFLEVRATDEGARRLYERAGFRTVGLRRGYYQPEGADALVMRMDLRETPPIGPEVAPTQVAEGAPAGTAAGGAGPRRRARP